QPGTQETRAFLEYAAHEVAAIASELDRSIAALTDDAMDREPLRAVLRRQRGLLGSARLDDIPVLAEALRAVEDLTSVIGKLDVPVRHEWLDVFRCARDVLAAAAPLLETGRQPDVTTALRRLRVLRHELLERHGVGEAVSTAHEGGLSQPEPQDELVLDEVVAPPSAEPVQPAESSSVAGDPAPIPAGPQTEGVDVRELQYRGERALQRAADPGTDAGGHAGRTRGTRGALRPHPPRQGVSARKPRRRRRLLDWRALIGIGISVALLWWAFHEEDPAAIWAELKLADPLLFV